MLEIIMGQQREKKKSKTQGKVGNHRIWRRKKGSLLQKQRDEADTEHGHTDAVPLLLDHWACLEYPRSFLISVHDQPFPPPTINLLMLF